MHRGSPPRHNALLILAAASYLLASQATAANFTLKNGMQVEGAAGKISSLGEDPLRAAGAATNTLILFTDDKLRRTYFSTYQRQTASESGVARTESIRIDQPVARNKRRVVALGAPRRGLNFNEYGRTTLSVSTPRRPINVVVGITEITPLVTTVEGLRTGNANSYTLDMRLATSSIPGDVLSMVIKSNLNKDDPDDRLKLVRLYTAAGRYKDARLELEAALLDFPELADLRKQAGRLRQLEAEELIREIELRRDGGQHPLVYDMLRQFPDEGVAGETLLKVKEMLDEYVELDRQGRLVLEKLEAHTAQLKDEAQRKRVEASAAEIARELNFNTLVRMADYLRLADDEKLSAEQKVSLAISGWLLDGGAEVTENLAVALSLVDVRDAVVRYLRSTRRHEREDVLDALASMEGSEPRYLSRIVAAMKPPVETEVNENALPGEFELKTAGLQEDPEITYRVQLPPHYDPYRKYPCVVTLNGAGSTPQQQIDWWAGEYNEKTAMRMGQASRRGYIVIAPQWSRPRQYQYEYSAREHAAVLYSLRDASRRFSIDSDRVFLSGHSMGGDAAWDVGLAHPDLWAGVLPVVAVADKYVTRYWENAKHVPLYFVAGQLDGDKMVRNADELNKYLTRVGFDTMVVEYQGRGHEHFADEIQRMFAWMRLHQRNFFPREFECVSMRPWDNYYWWVEVDDFPQIAMVPPVRWPARRAKPARTVGRVLENNVLSLKTGAENATVFLSPEIVNFDERVTLLVEGRRWPLDVKPSARTLLEDVRTRADRLHPFWAKQELVNGRPR